MNNFIIACLFLGASQSAFSKIKPDNQTVFPLNKSEYTLISQSDSDSLNKVSQMVKVVEINNYPSPECVLEYAPKLKLSPVQVTKIRDIKTSLESKSNEMEVFINQHEKKLNDLFASGKVNEGAIIYYTNKLGLFEGELRNAYLQAYLKTRLILSPSQIKKYSQLSGYSK